MRRLRARVEGGVQAAAAFGGRGRDGDALRDGRRDGGERQALRAEERHTSWMQKLDRPSKALPRVAL